MGCASLAYGKLKKSINYLIIIAANLIILAVLLVLWTDELELTFNEIIRGIEVFKIAGFGVLTVIGVVILDNFFRRRKVNSPSLKVVITVIATLVISSFLYIGYIGKVIDHTIINRQFRKQIADKIEPLRQMAYGTMARNLTIEEYLQIRKVCGFPALSSEASDIQYKYSYDGFLPDSMLELTYYVPVRITVDTINYLNGGRTRRQSFQIAGNRKKVIYVEYEQ